MGTIESFESALLDLDKLEAKRLLELEIQNGVKPLELVEKIVVPTLERIGDAWQEGTLALSQIYMSGRICEGIIDQLLPPASGQSRNQPHIGIAVLNDYHLLGKRIIYSQLRSAGFEVIDYGRKTVTELIQSIVEDKIEVILISTLMYPSALKVKDLKQELQQVAPDVKIIVGGAPFNMDSELWKEVGANSMGRNGGEVIAYINNLVEDMT